MNPLGKIELLPVAMPMSAPVVVRSRIIWPWRLTRDERKAERASVRGESLDAEHLDRVLEERTIRANQGTLHLKEKR
jgi:hypothetical protein